MRRWLGGVLFCSLLVHCATSEEDPNRKKPGGYDDAGKDSGGSGGQSGGASGGSAGNSGADGSSEASDGAPDADASSDAIDAAGGSSGEAGDAASDVVEAGPGGRLLLVARSATQITFGETTGSSWTTKDVSRATLSAPAIVATSWGALSVVRDQTGNALAFSSWDPATGAWSAFAQIAAGGMTIATPALAGSTDVHLAFLGTNFNLYSNVYAPGSGWQSSFSNVEFGSVQSFGPSAPALAAAGSGAIQLAQEGNDHDLYTQLWQGSWQAALGHSLSVKLATGTPPAATERAGSGKVVVAWIETGTSRVMWTEGSGTTWTSPAAVHPQAFSPSTPALAGLANGDVVLGYRALDDKLYATLLTGTSFAQPALVHPSLGTTTSPAAAPGVGGHVAELAWVSGGSVQHASLGSSGWSGPSAVSAAGHQAVALATYDP